MEYDDIVYVSILVLCIAFGKIYRNFKDAEQAKLIGTGVGLLITFIVSGWHILHPLISGSICTLIILLIDKRKCHLVSFVFMFGYLFFFRTTDYFGIPLPSGHTNMIQMVLTLKLVGLAFEVNTAHTNLKSDTADDATHKHEMETFGKLNFIDIFHYSFNYIGVLTGPYLRYRTFKDYFALPFRNHADADGATLKKFAWVPLFVAGYLTVSFIWPVCYASSTEFYEDRSILYRLLYVWPAFFIFRMRIYIGITLSECVCTMASFGAYPVESDVAAGSGPRKTYLEFARHPEELKYDFETIRNVDAYATDTCITFREAMKHWNMCVQYWLAVNVYKRFPNKAYRIMVTLLVSAYWHGVYPGYYFCILGAPFYLPVEGIWQLLIRNDATGLKLKLVNAAFWVSKFFAYSYMGIAFQLMSLQKIWFYYSSVYHLGYIYFLAMYIAGRILYSMQRKSRKAAETMTTPSATATAAVKKVV